VIFWLWWHNRQLRIGFGTGRYWHLRLVAAHYRAKSFIIQIIDIGLTVPGPLVIIIAMSLMRSCGTDAPVAPQSIG
jgi:hypothetical protein